MKRVHIQCRQNSSRSFAPSTIQQHKLFSFYLSQDYKRERNYANEYRTRDAHPRSWLVLKSVQGVSKSDQLFFPVLFRIPALYLLLFQSPFYFHRSTPVSFNFSFLSLFFFFCFSSSLLLLSCCFFISFLFSLTIQVVCRAINNLQSYTSQQLGVSTFLSIYIYIYLRLYVSLRVSLEEKQEQG